MNDQRPTALAGSRAANIVDPTSQSAWIKLSMLSNGVTISPGFSSWFDAQLRYVRRRNFYNSPGAAFKGSSPPQEIRIADVIPITVAVNNYGRPVWELSLDPEQRPLIVSTELGISKYAELLYDLTATSDEPELARLCNLYGGSALSFFSPRACYFFADGTECRFCSLAGTAIESDEFASRLTPSDIEQSVSAVVYQDSELLTQIMIVGGNERNLDRGFLHQVALVRAASNALHRAGLADRVSVHLIVMPPRNLKLIEELRNVTNLHVGFNLEVWDPDRFDNIAPGKRNDYGQDEILTALVRLRDIVGPYRAHSILIAGLEPPQSTIEGAKALAEQGISPIINAYHSDRHSAIGLSIRPNYQHLAEVAVGLQALHDKYPIEPYWSGCGRNALDFEAANGMFRGNAPNLEVG